MVDEQMNSYWISFELTKPNYSNPALLVYDCDEWGGAESRGNGARPVE